MWYNAKKGKNSVGEIFDKGVPESRFYENTLVSLTHRMGVEERKKKKKKTNEIGQTSKGIFRSLHISISLGCLIIENLDNRKSQTTEVKTTSGRERESLTRAQSVSFPTKWHHIDYHLPRCRRQASLRHGI